MGKFAFERQQLLASFALNTAIFCWPSEKVLDFCSSCVRFANHLSSGRHAFFSANNMPLIGGAETPWDLNCSFINSVLLLKIPMLSYMLVLQLCKRLSTTQ